MSATVVTPFLTVARSAASNAALRTRSATSVRWYSMRIRSQAQVRAADLIKHQRRGDRQVERVETAGHGNFDEPRARRREGIRQPRPLAAHEQQCRRAILGLAEILLRIEVRPDDVALKALRPAEKCLPGDAHQRHGEYRAHRRAHALVRIGIAARADKHDARGAYSVGRTDDGAEVAGIPHFLERQPYRLARDPCRRRQIGPALLEHAEDALRIVLRGELAEH